jgi:hypothetical protein
LLWVVVHNCKRSWVIPRAALPFFFLFFLASNGANKTAEVARIVRTAVQLRDASDPANIRIFAVIRARKCYCSLTSTDSSWMLLSDRSASEVTHPGLLLSWMLADGASSDWVVDSDTALTLFGVIPSLSARMDNTTE